MQEIKCVSYINGQQFDTLTPFEKAQYSKKILANIGKFVSEYLSATENRAEAERFFENNNQNYTPKVVNL